MATGSPAIKQWKENTVRAAVRLYRRLTEPSAHAEPKRLRCIRLLAVFLLLMAINAAAGIPTLKSHGGNSWIVIMAASLAMFGGYFISRTRHYRTALAIALIVPAIPPAVVTYLNPTGFGLTSELIWLALPLLIASVLLSVKQTAGLAALYIGLIIVLMATGPSQFDSIAPVLAFIILVAFFVAVIAQVRSRDVKEAAEQLTMRGEAEKALRESEEKFSRAFRLSPQQICITRLKDGMTLDINDTFTRTSGFTREDIISRTSFDLNLWTKPGDRERMMQILKTNGHVYNEEFDFRDKHGRIRTELFSAEPMTINGEECLICVITDISERKRMENALRESEEKFSKAFHASPQQIIITRARDNVTLEVNDSFCRVTGFTRDEVIGHTAEEIGVWVRPIDNSRMTRLLKTHGRVREEEFTYYNKQKQVYTQLVSIEPITIGGEPCWISILQDITTRKRMEQELRESEEKFSKAFSSSPEIIALINLTTGEFIDVNESLLQISGYTRQELVGHPMNELPIWEKRGDAQKLTNAVVKNGKVVREEYRFRTKSGEIRDWLLSADIITIGGDPCILAAAMDISRRKRMEKALRESEEKFSKAFSSSPNAILIVDIETDKIIEVNESFTRFTGYGREESIGRNSVDLKLWINDEEFQRMQHNLQSNGRIYNEEYHSRKKTGEVLVGLFSAETIIIGGKPCIIMVVTDITEQKQAERQLKLAMANLERSKTLLESTNKELQSFSYSVSHDLRSPLRSIDGFSQALLEDYNERLDDTGRDYLSRLRTASQKMGELIDGLLRLSRLTRNEIHPEDVDITALAREISARLKETHPDQHAEFIIAEGLTARGDPQMMRVLLENLLGNAWKFTGKTSNARIEVGSINDNGKKSFFIKDNGAGFDMAYSNKLFGAFQRLHDSADFPGTGIGLATVQRIINRHGGSIRAEGKVGKGATFYFSLS